MLTKNGFALRTLWIAAAFAWGSTPPAAAQLGTDEFLICNFDPPSIVHLHRDGTVLAQSSGGSGFGWRSPVVMPDGRWAVLRRDGASGRREPGINFFDPATGLETSTFDLNLPGPVFPEAATMSVFSDGTLAVLAQSTREVRYYDDQGSLLSSTFVPGMIGFPTTIDSRDQLWVADPWDATLRRFDRCGTLAATVPLGGGGFYVDLERGPDGTLWVATSFLPSALSQYAIDGSLLNLITTPSQSPGIAVAEDGTIWTALDPADTLRRLSANGTLLEEVPLPGEYTSISGILLGPTDYSAGNSICAPAGPNSTGQSAQLIAGGSASVCGLLTFHATGLPPGQLGLVVSSRHRGVSPMAISQGTLCFPAQTRLLAQPLLADQNGSFSFVVDPQSMPPGMPMVQRGETLNVQVWYRDANPGPTSNTTNGLRVQYH